MGNLRKLVFRHIKLKLLTKASISCLSHPFISITTWFMSVFTIACLRKIVRFFIFTGLCEKLQNIKLWKFAVFSTSHGTSSLSSMNKIGDGRVSSFIHLTWNDPYSHIHIHSQIHHPHKLDWMLKSSWKQLNCNRHSSMMSVTTYTHTILFSNPPLNNKKSKLRNYNQLNTLIRQMYLIILQNVWLTQMKI
jgi:hypothetical protein